MTDLLFEIVMKFPLFIIWYELLFKKNIGFKKIYILCFVSVILYVILICYDKSYINTALENIVLVAIMALFTIILQKIKKNPKPKA